MKPNIIYIYDALCSWCYGFSPVMLAVYENNRHDFDFEVISGGMILEEHAGRLGDVVSYMKGSYQSVEDATGIVFGPGFVHNLEKGNLLFSSEPPAIALSVFKSVKPERAVEFTHQLQNSIFFDGKDPGDMDVYRYLAVNFGIDPDVFEAKMSEPNFKEAAKYDFALARQLQVSSYPAVFIQESDSKFYLIARGYADYETMELRIKNVKEEMRFYS